MLVATERPQLRIHEADMPWDADDLAGLGKTAVDANCEAAGRRSFDVLAGVRMLQRDLFTHGSVLPETEARVCDEQLSHIAEGIDRATRTEFVLRRIDGELRYFDRGEWRPYLGMLLTGQRTARTEAANDWRRGFLAEWADSDFHHGLQMQALAPGERHVWFSAYPYEEEARSGAAFLRSCGLQPDRHMGFIYMAECRADGNVVLRSQTVDRSNSNAFAAAMHEAASPERGLDEITAAYDRELSAAHNGMSFRAGRTEAERHDVWAWITAQADLVRYMVDGLTNIASQPVDDQAREILVKRHVYGVWAAFKQRIDAFVPVMDAARTEIPYALWVDVAKEVDRAFRTFVNSGHVLVGCGGAIVMLKNAEDILNASSDDVFNALFGGAEDKYGSLTFKCSKGHTNTRPYNKLIERCRTCGVSVRC